MGPDGLENWHPRDLATLVDLLDAPAREQRMEALRERARQMQGR